MAIPDQNAFLAHAGNADVKAYVDGGGNFNDWWNNYGVNENRQWQPAGNAAWASAGPAFQTADNGGYASRYHEIRGIGTDFGALGMDVPDYSQTAVSTAAHRNPHHYVNPATGELNKDQLRQEIQSGAFRFNPDYYAAQNSDLAAAGITSGTDLMNHFLDYGWNEGRNYAIGDPGFKDGWSNASGNNMFGSHVANGVQLVQNHPDYNPEAAAAFWAKQPGGMPQGSFDGTVNPYGGVSGGWGSPNGFSSGQQQNQYGQYTDQFQNNLWNTTPQSPTYAANSWQTAYNQSPTLDPVYQANNGGAQNGFQTTWNQSNPFSIRTF